MQVKSGYLLTFLLLFLFSSFLFAGENDYATIDDPNYENVDVVIETAWGTSEKTEDVNVLILQKNEKATGVVLAKKRQKLSEIMLVEGVTVKIIDHETGKVLKTIKIDG